MIVPSGASGASTLGGEGMYKAAAGSGGFGTGTLETAGGLLRNGQSAQPHSASPNTRTGNQRSILFRHNMTESIPIFIA